MKILLFLLLACSAYADNQDIFNKAMEIGKKHKVNLNLKEDSDIDSYAKGNKFAEEFAKNAKSGTTNAHDLYDGQSNDSNYLFNKGTEDIKGCEKKSDPRCATLNKYTDKDTLNHYQAYSTGFSQRYYLDLKPDPNDSYCSIIKRKSPLNPTEQTCISSSAQYVNCSSTITFGIEKKTCDPNDGSCDQYKNNKNCTFISDHERGKCIAWIYYYFANCITKSMKICSDGAEFATPGWCGHEGEETKKCDGSAYEEGRGGKPGCFRLGPAQWVYSCKVIHYNDQCKRFK